ncbi:MAG TPA: sialidase family protein [Kofleriaceae bacterium]|nr:sialidase family protein [Kofleriaceae bacterium]
MTRQRDLLWLALVIVGAAPLPAAHANGRAPVTNGVYFRPADNQTIYVRSTFGLLVSHDAGCTFRWTCEQNVGYGGTFDPKYAIAADGTIFATTFNGLRVSRDGGCSFTTATAALPAGTPGRFAEMWVDALDIGPTGEVWAATAENGKPNDIFRSTDGGATFAPRGGLAPDIWWKSLRVAPSSASRVYATGYQVATPSPLAHVYTTDDGGASWTPASLTGVQLAASPLVRIAAVAPADPQLVYLVSSGTSGTDGDRLYRSTDAGATFKEVLATTQPIGDVIARDATTVLVASGEGTYRSADGGMTFGAATTSPRLGCLGQRPDGGLIGCAANWDPDFMAVGRSDDAERWQKIFRFIELAGPVECPAGTAGHDVCEVDLWPGLRAQFGATGPTCGAQPDGAPEPQPGGGCCDAGAASPLGMGLVTLLTAGLLRGRRARRDPDPDSRRAA